MSSSADDEHPGSRVSLLELTVGALSAAVLVAVVGLLAYQAISVPESPPDLSVTVIEADDQSPPYVLRLRVRNNGGQTAQEVQVGGELTRDGTVVEQASATARYIPPRSDRAVAIVFDTDPDTADLGVSVSGYEVARGQ